MIRRECHYVAVPLLIASSLTSTSTSRSRRELQITIEDYVELLGNRIRAGETNVKGLVMFSCVLAQIIAMQSGVSVEEEILKASTDSLRCCGEILELRNELQQSEWIGDRIVDGEVEGEEGGILVTGLSDMIWCVISFLLLSP